MTECPRAWCAELDPRKLQGYYAISYASCINQIAGNIFTLKIAFVQTGTIVSFIKHVNSYSSWLNGNIALLHASFNPTIQTKAIHVPQISIWLEYI